jgi:creatinine amidohydrolase/Fe(II)-dependent formamide hydrolase-like protein
MFRITVSAVLLWAVSVLASAQPSTVFLEELTSHELSDAIRGGKTTILVPIGGTEQNGPHMALGKHNARARTLAGRIAAKLGNSLVAPVIAYVPEGAVDPPTQHMRHPGTITIPEDVFEKTLESAARSFRHHGFGDIVLLGDHGGYQRSLRKVAEKLNREWAAPAGSRNPARVHAVEEYYRAAVHEFPRILKSDGFADREIGEHAGLADTALTMDTHPELVRSDRLAPRQPSAESGVRGDPTRASAELGRKGTALIVDATVEAVVKSIRAGRMARTTRTTTTTSGSSPK